MNIRMESITILASKTKDISKIIRNWLISVTFVLADYLGVIAAIQLACIVRAALAGSCYVSEGYRFFVIPAIYVVLFHFDKLHAKKLPFYSQIREFTRVSSYAIVVLLTFTYFTGDTKQLSRIFMLFVWLFSVPSLLLMRSFATKLLYSVRSMRQPILLIGEPDEQTLKIFKADRYGYNIIGVISDKENNLFNGLTPLPVLGNIEKTLEVVKAADIRNVAIQARNLSKEVVIDLIYKLQPVVDHITIVPELYGVPIGSLTVDVLFEEKVAFFTLSNNLSKLHNRIFKTVFDLLFGLLAFIIVLPVMLVIGLLIYIDSPGPIIFSHRRVGLNGEQFPCFKFRTMAVNAEQMLNDYLANNSAAKAEWEKDRKLKDDPRVTKIGQFLRRTSLDELPQIINVIRGEMSLIGPRPIVEDELPLYGKYANDYLSVLPGISGLWQVSGRNDVEYSERVKMDSWYVRNWSIWLDIMIALKTVKVILSGKGAY